MKYKKHVFAGRGSIYHIGSFGTSREKAEVGENEAIDVCVEQMIINGELAGGQQQPFGRCPIGG